MQNKTQNIDISIIVPVYNEEDNILEIFKLLNNVLNPLGKSFEIIFINDGSSDQSNERLVQLHLENIERVKLINLSRNFGHQIAITAGMNYCLGQTAVIMDADLQDPPELIKDFIKRWEEGYEIVYGVRKEREGETQFKKITAKLFYKIIRATTNIDIPENVGDFYLLDRKVINVLNTLNERHRFMRGLVAWVGFKRIGVDYIRKARYSGKTKYQFWKMVKFSFDAMTSFSFAPLRLVSMVGAIISFVAFLAILLIIYMKLFTNETIVGWSSLMAVVLFIGGVQKKHLASPY